MNKTRLKEGHQLGFTLLELLVAISILTMLMGILFSIFNESTRAWTNAQKQVEAFREARAALHVISRDLQNAFISPQLPFVFMNSVPGVSSEPGPSLFFVSSQPLSSQDSTDLSDLCAIGYYCAYTPNRGGTRAKLPFSYKLFRYFKRSNDTFKNIVRTATLNPLTDFFTFGNSPSLPSPSATLTGDEILAFNVCHLRFRYLTEQGTALTDTIPETFPKMDTATPPITDYPLQIEISLNAFNFDTAAKLYHSDSTTARAQWNKADAGPLQKLRAQNVQTFTVRVSLPKRSS
jgi:prepilin-type N-terminal cleavage/methylation domain-containing protein